MSIKSLLLSILLASNSLMALSQTSWEVDKHKDDIIVYTREERDSDFKAFKAFMVMEASLLEILEVLKNADYYSKWYGFTKTSTVLERENDTQYNYVETIFPWPYSNRDMVYKMSMDSISPNEILLSLEGIPNYLPEKKGIVRMKKAAGYIRLKSTGKNTELIYQFHSEPGDNIPIWLANRSIAELPFKTLSGLREQLKEKRMGSK